MTNIEYRGYLYDFLYLIGRTLIRIFNPCKIQKDLSGKVTCIHPSGPCCNSCRHLSNKGCATKALSCKLWLCNACAPLYPILSKILTKMSSIAYKNHISHPRHSKQETI